MVQAEIYNQKEGFEERRLRRVGEMASGGAPKLSVADEIAKLDELRRQGVLTEAEFQAMKIELLDRM